MFFSTDPRLLEGTWRRLGARPALTPARLRGAGDYIRRQLAEGYRVATNESPSTGGEYTRQQFWRRRFAANPALETQARSLALEEEVQRRRRARNPITASAPRQERRRQETSVRTLRRPNLQGPQGPRQPSTRRPTSPSQFLRNRLLEGWELAQMEAPPEGREAEWERWRTIFSNNPRLANYASALSRERGVAAEPGISGASSIYPRRSLAYYAWRGPGWTPQGYFAGMGWYGRRYPRLTNPGTWIRQRLVEGWRLAQMSSPPEGREAEWERWRTIFANNPRMAYAARFLESTGLY